MKKANISILGITILTLTLAFSILTCDNGTTSNTDTTPTFKPVTSITNVPTTGNINEEITLSGTVNPTDATNKTISWSIKDDGGTNSSLTGNKLTATSIGKVKITATIINGLTSNTDYTEDFEIVISDPSVKYTVTFNPDAAGSQWTVSVISGQKVSNPGPYAYSGHTFSGWYDAGDSLFDFDTPIISDITLTAKYDEIMHTITLMSDGSVYDTYNVAEGSTITAPVTDPTKTGYDFVEWRTGSASGSAYVWSTPIMASLTLYAGFSIKTYTVTFYDGATVLNTMTGVNHGSTISKPTDPVKSGYDFVDWYTNSGLTTAATWPMTITGNTNVWAKFSVAVQPIEIYYTTPGGAISINTSQILLDAASGAWSNSTKIGGWDGTLTEEQCMKAYLYVTSNGSNSTFLEPGQEIPNLYRGESAVLCDKFNGAVPIQWYYYDGVIYYQGGGPSNDKYMKLVVIP